MILDRVRTWLSSVLLMVPGVCMVDDFGSCRALKVEVTHNNKGTSVDSVGIVVGPLFFSSALLFRSVCLAKGS